MWVNDELKSVNPDDLIEKIISVYDIKNTSKENLIIPSLNKKEIYYFYKNNNNINKINLSLFLIRKGYIKLIPTDELISKSIIHYIFAFLFGKDEDILYLNKKTYVFDLNALKLIMQYKSFRMSEFKYKFLNKLLKKNKTNSFVDLELYKSSLLNDDTLSFYFLTNNFQLTENQFKVIYYFLINNIDDDKNNVLNILSILDKKKQFEKFIPELSEIIHYSYFNDKKLNKISSILDFYIKKYYKNFIFNVFQNIRTEFEFNKNLYKIILNSNLKISNLEDFANELINKKNYFLANKIIENFDVTNLKISYFYNDYEKYPFIEKIYIKQKLLENISLPERNNKRKKI